MTTIRFALPTVRSATLAALLAATLAACSANPAKISGGSRDDYRQMRTELNTKIPQLLKKYDLSSMVVMVLDESQVVYSGNFGYADFATRKKTTADTAYRIGSISKLFTATAIMQLQEQGKIHIDKPLRDYLPGLSINTPYGLDGITLRGVLSHYSGLPSDHNKGFSTYKAQHTILDDLSEETVVFRPGEVHAYSNLGYGLLGQVIEHVSNLSYADYLRLNIFDPLGMKNASVGNSVKPGFAVAYKDNKIVMPVEIRDRAAGDIRMSINDLALFAREILQYRIVNSAFVPRLLSRDSIDEMWRPQYEEAVLDSGFDMGLGWLLSYPSAALSTMEDLIWHDGSTFLYNSSLLINTQEKLAVIVMNNAADAQAPVSGEVAANTLLAAIRSRSGNQPEPYQPDSKPLSRFSADQVAALRGRYLSNEFGDFTVKGDEQKLSAMVDGQETILVPMDDGSFGIKFRLFGFIPFSPAEVKDLRFRLIDYDGHQVVKLDQGPPVAQRVKDKILPETINQYLGRYLLDNPDQMLEDLGFEELILSDANGYLRAEMEIEDETQVFFLNVLNNVKDGTRADAMANVTARVIGYGRGNGGTVLFDLDDQGRPLVRYSGLRFVRSDNS